MSADCTTLLFLKYESKSARGDMAGQVGSATRSTLSITFENVPMVQMTYSAHGQGGSTKVEFASQTNWAGVPNSASRLVSTELTASSNEVIFWGPGPGSLP